jgi:hypothetical protein
MMISSRADKKFFPALLITSRFPSSDKSKVTSAPNYPCQKKFTITPPNMMIKRCQAGLERNSHGCGSCLHLFFVHAFINHSSYFYITTYKATTQFRIQFHQFSFLIKKTNRKKIEFFNSCFKNFAGIK